MHELKAAPSRLHENDDPASVEVNWKVAVLVYVVPPVGPDVIDVSGGTVSPEPTPNAAWK